MKLLIVTAVEEFHGEIRSLFKKAGIENFSSSEIDGFKNQNALRVSTSWFPGEKGANESSLFFSFTAEEKIDTFFEMIKDFNEKILSPNPVRAI
ncbi:MAG: hypothetical protein HKN67_14535, partial [Saprospiraceae bacterium]|nr:hypothetical protein [Saprospiraceae bacterium]